MRTDLMHRDIDDVMSNRAHNVRVLDVQRRSNDSIMTPANWDVVVFENQWETRIVFRQHRLTGAVRIKAIPKKTIDLFQPEPYELEFLPDVPMSVVVDLLEILK